MRKRNFSTVFMVILIGILAIAVGFFYAKSRGAQGSGKSPKSSTSPNVSSSNNAKAEVDESENKDQAKTTPAPDGELKVSTAVQRPSKPKDTHTIATGETLLTIANQYDLTVNKLSEANGLEEPDKIQAGQILAIPKDGVLNFSVDETKTASLQSDADKGKNSFRRDPVSTAKIDSPVYYFLTLSDTYTLKNKDVVKGEAEVLVKHETKNYSIKLVQPEEKGDDGIWAIVSIASVK